MTATLLLEQFDHLIVTPADVEQLNRAILTLAVQGRLVEQDPNDAPVCETLKRSKISITPPISKNEKPFSLPSGWEWVHITDVTSNFGQKKPDKQFTYIDVSSINNQIGVLGDEMAIIDPENAPSRARKIVKEGCVIYSTVRPYLLNIAINDRSIQPEPIASTAFYVMKPNEVLDVKFLYFYLRSVFFTNFVEAQMTGMAYPAISDGKMSSAIIPLPPLLEQKRIVARVEQLFAQARALAEKLARAESDLAALAQSALAHLLSSETPEEFQKHWDFIVAHFDSLFTTPENIVPLRQAVLELAMRGKLTRREPGDEPARMLLGRIRKEKEERGKKEVIATVKESEKPFPLPYGWEWARFGELGILERGKSKHRPRNAPFLFENGKYPFVQTGDVAQSKGHITKYSSMYSEQGLAQSKMWNKGTLCITIAANIAETGILEFEACFPDSVVGFIPHPLIANVDYFQYFIRVAKSKLESYAPATAQKNINLSILNSLLIPLPPANEISRIVAKVGQLLGLCDGLESRLRAAQAERGRLVASVLARVGS